MYKKVLPAIGMYLFLACGQSPAAVNAPPLDGPKEEAEGIEYIVVGTPRRTGENLVEITLLQPGKRHGAGVSVSYCIGEDEERRRDLASIVTLSDGQKVRLRSRVEHGENICSGNFF